MSTAVQKEYEVVLLLTPDLTTEEAQKYVEQYKEEFLRGAEITFEDHWGKKTLAYPIQKKEQAYYVVLHTMIQSDLLKTLDEEMNIAPQIIRHLVTLWPKGAPKMTLSEIEAWNETHLEELKAPKKTQEEAKHAPRTGGRKRPPQKEETKPEGQ